MARVELNNKTIDESENQDPSPATSTPEDKTTTKGNIESCCLKYKNKRPSNIVVIKEDLLVSTLKLLSPPQCSPVSSPFPSNESLNDDSLLNKDDDDENSCHEITPTNNDDDKIDLTIGQRKIISLLRHFGLSHLAFIFIEQEIDVDLFLTLSNEDLEEIGIERNTDRHVILSVIAQCKKHFGF